MFFFILLVSDDPLMFQIRKSSPDPVKFGLCLVNSVRIRCSWAYRNPDITSLRRLRVSTFLLGNDIIRHRRFFCKKNVHTVQMSDRRIDNHFDQLNIGWNPDLFCTYKGRIQVRFFSERLDQDLNRFELQFYFSIRYISILEGQIRFPLFSSVGSGSNSSSEVGSRKVGHYPPGSENDPPSIIQYR